jgi:hypothetical protein
MTVYALETIEMVIPFAEYVKVMRCLLCRNPFAKFQRKETYSWIPFDLDVVAGKNIDVKRTLHSSSSIICHFALLPDVVKSHP